MSNTSWRRCISRVAKDVIVRDVCSVAVAAFFACSIFPATPVAGELRGATIAPKASELAASIFKQRCSSCHTVVGGELAAAHGVASPGSMLLFPGLALLFLGHLAGLLFPRRILLWKRGSI
jgi:hypothetical protein